jgi:hypothetical protein
VQHSSVGCRSDQIRSGIICHQVNLYLLISYSLSNTSYPGLYALLLSLFTHPISQNLLLSKIRRKHLKRIRNRQKISTKTTLDIRTSSVFSPVESKEEQVSKGSADNELHLKCDSFLSLFFFRFLWKWRVYCSYIRLKSSLH